MMPSIDSGKYPQCTTFLSTVLRLLSVENSSTERELKALGCQKLVNVTSLSANYQNQDGVELTISTLSETQSKEWESTRCFL